MLDEKEGFLSFEKMLELWNKEGALSEDEVKSQLAAFGQGDQTQSLIPQSLDGKVRPLEVVWVKDTGGLLEEIKRRLAAFGPGEQAQALIPQSFGDTVRPLGPVWCKAAGICAPSFRSSANLSAAADTPIAIAKQPPTPARRYSQRELTKAYNEYVNKCVEDGCRPSREADVAAMRTRLGVSIPKRAIYWMRRDFAPADWKQPGPRPKKEGFSASMTGPQAATGHANPWRLSGVPTRP